MAIIKIKGRIAFFPNILIYQLKLNNFYWRICLINLHTLQDSFKFFIIHFSLLIKITPTNLLGLNCGIVWLLICDLVKYLVHFLFLAWLT